MQVEHERVFYRLALPETEVSIDITNLKRLFNDPLKTPHGPLRRLPTTFPLHWHILATSADAHVTIKRQGKEVVRSTGKARAPLPESNTLSLTSLQTWRRITAKLSLQAGHGLKPSLRKGRLRWQEVNCSVLNHACWSSVCLM